MVDLDNIFKYASPKYVYIRNAKLGIMKYFLMLMIFLYVVVYEMVYSCTHLEPHHASGFGSISIQHPTEKCDPLENNECMADLKSISGQAYCEQSPQDETVLKDEHDENASVGMFITKPLPCRYFDGQRVLWSPPQPSELFIPTKYQQIQQEISPECYDPEAGGVKGAHGGRSKYACSKPWITKETNEYYVADIEDFDIFLKHTFQQPTLGLSGTSIDYQGFFAACKTNHPKTLAECERMKIPNSMGDVAPEDLVGLTDAEQVGVASLLGTPVGDRVRFGDLLTVTPVSQKHGMGEGVLDAQVPPEFAHSGKSLREVGGMILLDVNYDNVGLMRPGFTIGGFPSRFKVKPVTYTYRPYFLPMRQNVKLQILQNGNFPNKRTIDKWYGVTVRMQFNGLLVKYSFDKVITGLTNGLVLLAVATTLVMYVAAYVLPLKEKYNLLMYQMSEDLTDYKHLKEAIAGKPAESMYASGQLLLNRIKGKTALTNEEIIDILCSNEVRLNRLDGMDPKMTFIEGDEHDLRKTAVDNFACAFYSHQSVPLETLRPDGYQRVQCYMESRGITTPYGRACATRCSVL